MLIPWHPYDIKWVCAGLLKAGVSTDIIYNRLFAPEKPLAGALNLQEIEQIRKDEAKLVVHGRTFRGQSYQEIYQELFAPECKDLHSPWRGALTLEEIIDVFQWSPTRSDTIKRERMIKQVTDEKPPDEIIVDT